MRIQIHQGDLTRLDVDAIVNAANSSLLGGGGVDGAIHRAAGPELLAECRLLGGCKTGDAKITRGYKLAARHVIHAVGPVWQGGGAGEPALLASCYRRSIEVAREHRLATIAFPGISTGIFRYPLREAAQIAVSTIAAELAAHALPRTVILCTFDDAATRAAEAALAETTRDPRAELAAAQGRGDRATAAAILERDLGDRDGAIEVWKQVLTDDETDRAAAEALTRLYRDGRDWRGLVTVLEHRAQLAATDAEAASLLRALIPIYADELADDDRAADARDRLADLEGPR